MLDLDELGLPHASWQLDGCTFPLPAKSPPLAGYSAPAGGPATVAGQVLCDLGALNKIEEIDPFARGLLPVRYAGCRVHRLKPNRPEATDNIIWLAPCRSFD
ncbi:hypothetical protein EH240_23480 [Mesorhizobium tamadayense]|uniref:Uncharacterized protein n=1 Tax=Mesorhizobium tamadayense TaxID=425306 RepID=A0A3P3FBL4_9HYPH|nr:hypothetical protein [Mesorhizobium tamadayense]RRH95971.1 hypothetical protein EH240_23480 [Mesorhizobium tamadayense]